jgi:hypothetical protein
MLARQRCKAPVNPGRLNFYKKRGMVTGDPGVTGKPGAGRGRDAPRQDTGITSASGEQNHLLMQEENDESGDLYESLS